MNSLLETYLASDILIKLPPMKNATRNRYPIRASSLLIYQLKNSSMNCIITQENLLIYNYIIQILQVKAISIE